MKSDSKWSAEVSQAYRKWKRDSKAEYDKFTHWNSYHRKKFFKSKSHETGIGGRIERILYG